MSKKKPRGNCKFCGESLNRPEKVYCNNQCQKDFESKKYLELVKKTNNLNPKNNKSYNLATAKKHLKILKGCKCEICGMKTWQGQDIPLVFDHIDGNHENNDLDNCRLICGNCDMQTDTYKGKNKGNGRYTRSQRYKDGKSY